MQVSWGDFAMRSSSLQPSGAGRQEAAAQQKGTLVPSLYFNPSPSLPSSLSESASLSVLICLFTLFSPLRSPSVWSQLQPFHLRSGSIHLAESC